MSEEKSKNLPEFLVRMPFGINYKVPYTGRVICSSARGAVSRFIARYEPDKVGIIMSELDREYDGAEKYASRIESVRTPFIDQSSDDLRRGQKLDRFDRKVMKEHAFAYELASRDKQDTNNSDVQFHYLKQARIILYGFG